MSPSAAAEMTLAPGVLRPGRGHSVSLRSQPGGGAIDRTQPAVLLSLGANIGDRAASLARAVELIGRSPGIELVRVSSLYETAPVGYLAQPAFINAAALLRTTREPAGLLARLRAIERVLGRVRRTRWHEREIDIDILLYGERIVDLDDLQIPHHEMQRRRFVLEPAAEIAPDLLHPRFGLTIAELLARCPDRSGVTRLDDPTQHTHSAQ